MYIDYPMHVDKSGRTATTAYEDHIRDLIHQVLLTSPGERVNRPDFGSGLRQMVFCPHDDGVAAALELTIRANLQKWIGDLIDIARLEVVSCEASLLVTIEYLIRKTDEQCTSCIRMAV